VGDAGAAVVGVVVVVVVEDAVDVADAEGEEIEIGIGRRKRKTAAGERRARRLARSGSAGSSLTVGPIWGHGMWQFRWCNRRRRRRRWMVRIRRSLVGLWLREWIRTDEELRSRDGGRASVDGGRSESVHDDVQV